MGRRSGTFRGIAVNAIAFLLAFAAERAVAAADPVSLETVKAEISLHDFDAAAGGLERLAAAGNPEAEYLLGVFYLEGLDGPANSAMARQWLEKAASQGNGRAALSLATLLAHATPPDPRGAQHWLARARELGYRPGQTAVNRLDDAAPPVDGNLAA